MDEGAEQRIGLGFGIIYGHRRLDPSKLTFEEQFVGNGFDTNLPTGEAAFSNMKPYISTSAGLIYTNKTWRNNFELGVAAFHINKPKQSFLDDDNQFLPRRYVVHSNFETTIANTYTLTTNGIYQYQSGASYFSIGGALGYSFSTYHTDVMVNAGLWYWSKNAIIPYMGLTYGRLQLGLSYDITISKLADAPVRPHTFELCMIFRGDRKPDGVIPAPWK
jgi:type IX secretion system PorP/SprF family membrane protein